MPTIRRLRTFTRVASSVRIGFAAPPIFEPGIGELIVATSLFTVLPVMLIPPGTALATQLFILVQVASTGALVQVWLAAEARSVAAASRPSADKRGRRTRVRDGREQKEVFMVVRSRGWRCGRTTSTSCRW